MWKGKDNSSKHERLAFDDLTKKMMAKWRCEYEHVSRNRQKLAAP